jgi:hypothetical protein
MREKIITAEEYKQARENTDDYWSDWDVFEEERDRYPLRGLVLEAVEGEFTHPSGDHTVMTLSDSVSGLVSDYVSDSLPDAVPNDVTRKFEQKTQKTVNNYAEQVYVEVREREDEFDSVSELQKILEEEANSVAVPETR